MVKTRCLQPAFVGVEHVKKRLDLLARQGGICRDVRGQPFGSVVVPAALVHKRVPDLRLPLGGLVPVQTAPCEDFLVRATRFYALYHIGIMDSQEAQALAVKPNPQVRHVIGGKLPRRVETDLVQHPPEMIKAAHFLARAAKARYVHWGVILCRIPRFGNAEKRGFATEGTKSTKEGEGIEKTLSFSLCPSWCDGLERKALFIPAGT